MNRNKNIKTGLLFGVPMAIFYILQNLVTHSTTTRSILMSIAFGLLEALVSTLLFVWLFSWFTKSKFFAKNTRIDLDEDEQIVMESPANHFKGIEGVSGKLYLTNKRLVFKSHKLNIQNHYLSIDIKDIQYTERYKNI